MSATYSPPVDDEAWRPEPDEEPLDPTAQFALEVAYEAHKIRVREAAQRMVRTEQRRDLGSLEPIRLTEFLAIPDEPVQYRINSLWPLRGRVMLSAQWKVGKTTLVGNAIRALADSLKFLDRFDTVPARVILLDFEMDEGTVRHWLRDQRIRNTDDVQVLPLRGKASSFDILDPQTRSAWASRLRGNDVVILDCLRPILDALGLSEGKTPGALHPNVIPARSQFA